MTEKATAPANTGAEGQSRSQGSRALSVAEGRDMGKQPGSGLERLAAYDDSKHLVLHPVTVVQEGELVSPALVQSVSILHPPVNPDPQGSDVYAAWWKKGRLAPTAHLLRRIGITAGVRWTGLDLHGGVQVDPRTGHRRVVVTAEASCRMPNGEWMAFPGIKEIDTAVLEEKWLNEERDKAAAAKRRNDRSLTEEQIVEKLRRRILQMKEKLVPEARTKAMSAALRGLLDIQQDYSPQEMHRPVVVPRLLYRPDVAMAIEQGSRAVGELYGGSPGGPLGQDAPSSSLSTAEEPPRDEEPPAVPTGQTTQRGKPSESEAEGTAGDAPVEGPVPPREDPIIEEPGQYKGERMSHVADIDVAYLRGMLAATRGQKKRAVIQGWIDYQHPTLGG